MGTCFQFWHERLVLCHCSDSIFIQVKQSSLGFQTKMAWSWILPQDWWGERCLQHWTIQQTLPEKWYLFSGAEMKIKIFWVLSRTFKAPNLLAVLVTLAWLSFQFESRLYFWGLLLQYFLNLPSLCSSKGRTPAMLLPAYCDSHAVRQMINKSLLYNINKLSALLSVACCHQSKSCVSKALICESLFSYLASFSIQTLLSSCNKNICLFFQ